MVHIFSHWIEFTLQVGSFKPLVFHHAWDCYVGLIALALVCVALPLWDKSNFPIKSSLSKMENTPGIGLKLLQIHMLQIPSAHRALDRGAAQLIFSEESTRWEKCNHSISLQTTIGAGVFSMSGKYSARCKFQASSFFKAECPSISMWCSAPFGIKEIFHTKSEHFWSGFQATEWTAVT